MRPRIVPESVRASGAIAIAISIGTSCISLPAHAQLNLRYHDGQELGLLLSQWGCETCDDIDGDCDVDIDDLAIFISLWGSIQPRLDYSRCPDHAWRPPLGEDIPDYDFQWATVTDPFNKTYEGFGDSPPKSFPGFGRVDYEYRIATTEVTAEQYLEFVNAYKPFAEDPTDSELLGPLIFDFTVVGTGELVYSILPGWEQAPTPMSWRMAARYCNWLHNGKVHEAWAFESGVYDTSTFTAYLDPDTGKIVINDQRTRSDGARFWIPNLDEWTKAAHYDPHKHGENQPGYWLFPTSSDEPPIYDLPENGGESSGGLREGLGFFGDGPIPHVGWYPHVTSPWGAMDMSGGWSEWTETFHNNSRYADGSRMSNFLPIYPGDWISADHIQSLSPGGITTNRTIGLRIASALPTPAPPEPTQQSNTSPRPRGRGDPLHFAERR